jgi:CcmD family protein
MKSALEPPSDRATTFQAVQGGEAEHYSGEVLLVSAYAIVWVMVLSWVALMWRKQSALGARIDDLQRVLDKASTAKEARLPQPLAPRADPSK